MTDEELFPHYGFPIRVEYDEGKDHKICWFQSENHLEKHITRYHLNPNEIKIQRHGEQNQTDFGNKPTRKSTKSTQRKSVRGVPKQKTRKSKSATPETIGTQPRKRGRPKKVRD